MANEIYDSTWWGNTIDTASSIGTSTEMIQGQFNLTKLGDELVTNGNFAEDLSGWTIASNDDTHSVTWSIDGANFVSDTTSPIMTFGSPISLIADKKYKFIIKLKNNGGTGTIKAQASGLNFILDINDGIYEEIVTPTQNQSSVSFYRNGSNIDLYIQSFSVKEVRATTVEASKCLADTIHRIGLQDIQN